MTSFEDSDFTGMVVQTKLCGRLELGPLLGKGAAALVYRGLDRATGISFAVKVNRNEEALSTLIDVPDNYEVTVMRRLHQHPNVLGLLESATLGGFTCYVTKLADRGDLLVFLQEQRALPEALARDLFSQLTSAVAYAHKNGVVHRDIKLENLLLTSDQAAQHGFRLLLADWGYAAPWSPGDPGLRDSCGSLHYCPPEILQGQLYEGRPTDVWSLGVVLYALLIGRFPFFGRDTNSIVSSIMQGLPIYPRPQAVTREAWSLLHQCLHHEPSFRPSLELIRSHAWMQGRERYQVARRSASDMGTHAILKQGEVRGISHSAPNEQSDTQKRIQAESTNEAAGSACAEGGKNSSSSSSSSNNNKHARPVRRKARARQKSQDHTVTNGVAPAERRRQVSFSGEFETSTIVARHSSRTEPADLSKSTDGECSDCTSSESKSKSKSKSSSSKSKSSSSKSKSSSSKSKSSSSKSGSRSSSGSGSGSKTSPEILDSSITKTDHDEATSVIVSAGRRMLGAGKERARPKKRCSSGVHFLHSSCGGQVERPEPTSSRISSGPSCVARHSSGDDKAARDPDAEQHRHSARKTRSSSASGSKKSVSRIRTGPRSLFATFTNASSKRSSSKRTSRGSGSANSSASADRVSPKSLSSNSSASADQVRSRSRSMDLSAKCGVRTRSLSSVATAARGVPAKTTTSGEFPAVGLRQRSPRGVPAKTTRSGEFPAVSLRQRWPASPKESAAQRKADDSHPRERSAVTAGPSETSPPPSYRSPSTSSHRHFLREHTSAVSSFAAHTTESFLRPHTPLALEPCRTPRLHRITPSFPSSDKNAKAVKRTAL